MDVQMPKNLPINIIFYVFWDADSNELDRKVSYMNVVYTLTLATQINVSIDYGDSRVITTEGDDLRISTMCSGFYDQQASECDYTEGLSFQWECATYGEYQYPRLAEYCRKWKGSPVIVIPNTMMVEINALNKPIRIRVVVTSVEASEQTGQAAADLQFKMTDNDPTGQADLFTWVTTAKPKFTIVFPQPDNTVLVTKDQEIRIVPDGWRPQDGYEISFSAIDETEATINFGFDNVGIVQRIKAGQLKEDFRYELTVTVKRQADEEEKRLGLATEETVIE